MDAALGTRDRMLVTAGRLLRRQGLHATGTNQILTESDAPRGSLYFHFPGGKQQLAAESLALAGRELGARMARLLDAADNPGDAVVKLGAMFAQELADSDFVDGCPVATVALETASDSVAIASVCGTVYSAWHQGLADRLRDFGSGEAEARTQADFILATIQGALLMARVHRDVEVIRSVCASLAIAVGGAAPTRTTSARTPASRTRRATR